MNARTDLKQGDQVRIYLTDGSWAQSCVKDIEPDYGIEIGFPGCVYRWDDIVRIRKVKAIHAS